tara:strand:+ start:90 stop:545 length:456 start_codon:yes stop_codon:yes gene_type:complete
LTKWLRRLFLSAVLLTLLITNVLTLTSTAFNAALTGLVATAVGITTVTSKLHAQVASQKSSVRNMGRKLTARTKRIAAYSVAGIPASALPFAGMAILVAGTAIELALHCKNITEMEELFVQMEIDEDLDAETVKSVCHPSNWLSNKAGVQQ